MILDERFARYGTFDRYFNFDNSQPEIVSDVISGRADQDVSVDVCANFGVSRLKPSEVSFSALCRTSIAFDWK